MGVNRVKKRGKERIEVRRRWPDGTTFRRYCPNMMRAKRTLTRIENSIIEGKWQALRRELNGEMDDAEPKLQSEVLNEASTVQKFSERFMDHRRVSASKSWKRYVLSLRSLNNHLGDVQLE